MAGQRADGPGARPVPPRRAGYRIRHDPNEDEIGKALPETR